MPALLLKSCGGDGGGLGAVTTTCSIEGGVLNTAVRPMSARCVLSELRVEDR